MFTEDKCRSFIKAGLALCLVFAPFASAVEPGEKEEDWSLHAQGTLVPQYHPAFAAPYSNENSLKATPESEISFTSTLFLGRRLWTGGEFYVNPELTAGAGFSRTRGIAAFPNGEIYRVEDAKPRAYVSRLFLKQTFGLGGATEYLEGAQNQLGKKTDVHRFTFTVGKLSLNDVFDANAYAHDPRTQFLNWIFMDNGAWDYAADTRGYTWMLLAEYHRADWTFRAAAAMVPSTANGIEFDTKIDKARSENIEVEYRYRLGERAGKLRILAYMNHARMGLYNLAVGAPPVEPRIEASRDYRTKYGLGINVEQELTPEIGFFARVGWNDGLTETWAFTEIDQFLGFGAALKGSLWGREQDMAGVGFAFSGLSAEHAGYLRRGGIGFIIGDGKLNYGIEAVMELYYALRLFPNFTVTPDYQLLLAPAYNRDRGPVSIFSARIHYEI